MQDYKFPAPTLETLAKFVIYVSSCDFCKSFKASFLKIGFVQKKMMEFNEEAPKAIVALHKDNNVSRSFVVRKLVTAIGTLHIYTKPTTIAHDLAIL